MRLSAQIGGMGELRVFSEDDASIGPFVVEFNSGGSSYRTVRVPARHLADLALNLATIPAVRALLDAAATLRAAAGANADG